MYINFSLNEFLFKFISCITSLLKHLSIVSAYVLKYIDVSDGYARLQFVYLYLGSVVLHFVGPYVSIVVTHDLVGQPQKL